MSVRSTLHRTLFFMLYLLDTAVLKDVLAHHNQRFTSFPDIFLS
jgi:hypothetical protein